ncbi:MAG: BatD family protein, partial [Kiritimatiellia bacterium]
DQDDVKIIIEASRETVLVGEPFDLRLRVLIRRLPDEHAHIDPLFPDDPPVLTVHFLDALPQGLQGVDLREFLQQHLVRRNDQPGLALNEYTLADGPFSFRGFFESFGERRRARFVWPRTAVTVDDIDYFAYELELRLVPEEENDYVFGPAVFKGQVPVTVDAQGRAAGRHVFAVGNACTVRVTPPPEEGRPASFTGGIGTTMRVSASLDCLSCNVGDPVQLTLEIEGDLRFDRMLSPRLSQQAALLEDFTVYDQTVETMVDSEYRRRYVYSIRPHRAGLLEVPALEAAYFDTVDRAYHLRYTQPVPLEVKPGIAFSAEQIIGVDTGLQDQAEDVPVPPAELEPGPLWTDAAAARPGRLMPGAGLWAVALAGPWCFAMVWLGQVWHDRRAARRAAQRRAAALPQARQALRKLRNLPEQEAVALVCPLVRKFLGALLDCSTAGLTPLDLYRLLAGQGVSPELIAATIELYQRYFDAVFHHAPVANLPEDMRVLETCLRQIAAACRISGGAA